LSRHKYAREQKVCTDNDTFRGNVEIVALLDTRCHEHDLPRYGCVCGDQHFTFCEEMLAPLNPNQKRSLN
jgi:hypothetical protein